MPLYRCRCIMLDMSPLLTLTYLSRISFDGIRTYSRRCGNGGMVSFGSFGVSASGGGQTEMRIGASLDTDKFKAYVFGYSENTESWQRRPIR